MHNQANVGSKRTKATSASRVALLLVDVINDMDFYLRDFELFIPADCVVSNTKTENSYALKQMTKILKANVAPSSRLRLGRLK